MFEKGKITLMMQYVFKGAMCYSLTIEQDEHGEFTLVNSYGEKMRHCEDTYSLFKEMEAFRYGGYS